jgi:hypothetical protein
MSNQLVEALVAILTSIVGLAALAVLVSKRADTSNVLKAGGGAFANMLSAATAPVTGGGTMPGSSYSIGSAWPGTPGF